MSPALDTNRYSDLCRGDQSVIDLVELVLYARDAHFDALAQLTRA